MDAASLATRACCSRTPCVTSNVSSQAGGGDGTVRKTPVRRFFQTLDRQHAGRQIHPIGGERQGFGEPTPRIGKRQAEGAHLAIGELGLAQKSGSLAGSKIFAGAVGRMQRHSN